MKGLTVGRMVHYVYGPGEHLAAIVNEVVDKPSGRVGLTVFAPIPFFVDTTWSPVLNEQATYSPEPITGTWHWIERED